jgi:hypothetical protein
MIRIARIPDPDAMASWRVSRIVIPDVPHHVMQRGNRRQALFTEPSD